MSETWDILLTDKERAFVKSYVLHLNASKAMRDTGYEGNSAATLGYRMLRNGHILDAIEAYKYHLSQTFDLPTYLQPSPERVIKELARLSFYDPRKFYNDDGSLKPVPELDEHSAAVLHGFDVEERILGIDGASCKVVIGKTIKIKLPDKKGANELLGRYYGLFEKDNLQQRDRVIIVKDID